MQTTVDTLATCIAVIAATVCQIVCKFYEFILSSVNVFLQTIVPTVAPDNFAVRVVSTTALYVSWSSVFTLVGDVRDYIVRLLEVDTGLVTNIRSAATSITVPVHPAYTYNCSVSAVTVSHGPFSTVITVQTPQDGKVSLFV